MKHTSFPKALLCVSLSFIFYFSFFTGAQAHAQQLRVASQLEEVPQLAASVGQWVTDNNGDSCALVRVYVLAENTHDIKFDGDIMDTMKLKDRDNEWLVWMTDRAGFLYVTTEHYAPLMVEFDKRVRARHAYSLTIDAIEELTLVAAPYIDPASSLEARKAPKAPGSNKQCALIRLNIPIDDVTFEGNVSSERHAAEDEWWIWVAPGTGTVTVRAEGYAAIVLQLQSAKSQTAYRAALMPPAGEDETVIDSKRQQMEEQYARWKTSGGSAAATLGEQLLNEYPTAFFADEVKHALFEYYLPISTDKAAVYAVSRDEKERLEARIDKLRREENARRRTQHLDDIQWRPAIGAGLEIAPLSACSEIAIPVDIMFFEDTKKFDFSIGARIAKEGVWMDNYDTSFSYWQFSPKVTALYNMGGIYFGLTGLMNLNFGYKLGTNQPLDNVLTTPTFGAAAEAGFYIGDVRLYIYYKYDITRPVSDATLGAMRHNPSDHHYEVLNLANGNMLDIYRQRGMLGAGLVVYFASLRPGHGISH